MSSIASFYIMIIYVQFSNGTSADFLHFIIYLLIVLYFFCSLFINFFCFIFLFCHDYLLFTFVLFLSITLVISVIERGSGNIPLRNKVLLFLHGMFGHAPSLSAFVSLFPRPCPEAGMGSQNYYCE